MVEIEITKYEIESLKNFLK